MRNSREFPWCVLLLLFLAGLLSKSNGVPSKNEPRNGVPENGHKSDSDLDENVPPAKKILVLMLNGFRWDFVSRDAENLQALQKMEMEGSKADYLESCFPSHRYPAWTTISTGQWPEEHGIIGNYFYDRSTEDVFDLTNTNSTRWRKWWQNAEPIWITAERLGRNVSLYQWSRCDVDFKGSLPKMCSGYNASRCGDLKDLKEHLDAAMSDLEGNVNLAMVYNEFVGNIGRKFGPDSEESFDAVRKTDAVLEEFLTALNNSKIANHLNVMVISDHGMTSLDTKKKIIVEDRVEKHDLRKVVGRESYMNILPQSGAEKSVQNALKKVPGIQAYRRHAIPRYLHFGNAPLGLTFLLVANESVYLQGFSSNQQIPRGPEHGIPEKGLSGYNPIFKDMRGIFYAVGPAFTPGFAGRPLKIVDLNLMIRRILDIEHESEAEKGDSVEENHQDMSAEDTEETQKATAHLQDVLSRVEVYVSDANSRRHRTWARLASVVLPILALFLGRVPVALG